MYNEDFIAEMRANPKSWGRQYGKNSVCTSKGHVEIYNVHSILCSITSFSVQRIKIQLITRACNEIKNLKGYYVVVSFYDKNPQSGSKRKRQVYKNTVIDKLF